MTVSINKYNVRKKVEERLLPPPQSVEKLTTKKGYKYGSTDHKKLVREALPWAIDALAAAHTREKIKQAERNLFASNHFGGFLECTKNDNKLEFIFLKEKL